MSDTEELFAKSAAEIKTNAEVDPESAQNAEAPSSNPGAPSTKSRTRMERKFPALTFSDAIELAEGIQVHAAGQKVRRLTLFEKMGKSPDSSATRQLVTSSGQYGLTKGGYSAEFLELTPEGKVATGDEIPPAKKIQTRFELAVQRSQRLQGFTKS